MKKGYIKYKTSDVLLVSQIHWPVNLAIALGDRLKKIVIYLPCEVDDFSKALGTLSEKELRNILSTLPKKRKTK